MRMQNVLASVASWCLVLLLGLLPVFFVPAASVGVAQGKVAISATLLLIAVAAAVASRILGGVVKTPTMIILGAGLLLPLAYLASALIAGVSTISLLGTGVEQDTLATAVIWFSAFALSAVIFLDRADRIIVAMRALFLGGFVLAVFQALHFFFPQALSFGGLLAGQTANLFGSWHDAAILLGLLSFTGLFISSSIAGGGRFFRVAAVAVSILSLLILIPMNFQDVWIGVAAVSIVALIRRLNRESREGVLFSWKRHARWLAAAACALFFVFFGSFIQNILPSSLRVANVEVRPSWQGTLAISEQALVKPATLFFGAGPNTFARQWGLYKSTGVNATPFWNADFSVGVGSVLTSFVTVGIAGVLAWLALLAALLWLIKRTLMSRVAADSPHFPLVEPLAFSALYLFAFYVLYVPGPALSVLSFLIFGLFTAASASAGFIPSRMWSTRGLWQGAARLSTLLALGIVVALASGGMGFALASDITLNRGILAYNNTGDLDRASALVSTAIRLSPNNDRAQRAAVELGLLKLQKLSAQADPKDEKSRELLQKTLSDTIEHGLKAISIDSGDYENWLELASLYRELAGAKIEGAYDNARTAYLQAQANNPASPLPLLQLAQLELMQKNQNAALQYLELALQRKADFAPAYYLGSQIYAAKSDFKNAIPAAARAVQYAQDDPLAWYNLGLIAYAGEDWGNAAAALEQTLTREPKFADALYLLGLTYHKLNRKEDSIKVFESLGALLPDEAAVSTILTNLRAGRAPVAQEPAVPAPKTSTPARALRK